MFIQTETTPNPATLKFMPGREVMSEGRVDFPDAQTAPVRRSRAPVRDPRGRACVLRLRLRHGDQARKATGGI